MRWTVHGERSLYESEWLSLRLVDVEIPGEKRFEKRFEHHVVRFPADAAGTVIRDPDRGVLLLWRHRFITDTWGWEIPAGRIDEGETPRQAAAREAYEETGWKPGPLQHLFTYNPINGVCDQRFHVFWADGGTEVGPPEDPGEAEKIEWVSLAEVPRLIAGGDVGDGMSLTALLWVLAQPDADAEVRPRPMSRPARPPSGVDYRNMLG